MVMNEQDGIFCDLRYGVKLEIYNHPGKLTIQMVDDFLGHALDHFKHHTDVLKTGVYRGNPFCRTFKEGNSSLATMQLSHPRKADEPALTAELWTDAVGDGYTSVYALQDIISNLDMWKESVAKGEVSTFMQEVVGMVDEPGGDLPAMQVLMKQYLARDLEQGFYKPGEIVDVRKPANPRPK
jgi:hypothetical protein